MSIGPRRLSIREAKIKFFDPLPGSRRTRPVGSIGSLFCLVCVCRIGRVFCFVVSSLRYYWRWFICERIFRVEICVDEILDCVWYWKIKQQHLILFNVYYFLMYKNLQGTIFRLESAYGLTRYIYYPIVYRGGVFTPLSKSVNHAASPVFSSAYVDVVAWILLYISSRCACRF